MHRVRLIAAVGIILLVVGCGEKKQQTGHRLVSPAEFAQVMVEPGTVTLNVLGPSDPSIAGTDLAIRSDQLSARRSDLPPTSTKLAVYCWSGHTSSLAVPVLEQLGYTNIAELRGGMQAWSADGRKLVGGFS